MEQLESCVPPGFRFHPTEEELVGYYLERKINSLKIDLEVIVEIDLYKIEPWDIRDRCKLGYDEKNEWYFFSHKDKKYPTGTRTNRATTAGFWKATGRDKAVISKDKMIGMRKTLVFYKGRAPNGNKTDWIIHEYRLQTSEQGPPQEEGWVVCKAFRKPTPSHRQGVEAWNHGMQLRYQNYSTSPSFLVPDIANATHVVHSTEGTSRFNQLLSEEQKSSPTIMDSQIIELPPLECPNSNPRIITSLTIEEGLHQHNSTANEDELYNYDRSNYSSVHDQCLDWKSLDSVLASELRDRHYYQPNVSMVLHDHDMKAENYVTSMFEYYPDPNPRK